MSIDHFVRERSISGDRSGTPSPNTPWTPKNPPSPSSLPLSDEEMEPTQPLGEDESRLDEEGVMEVKKVLTGLEKYWQYHSFDKMEPAKKLGSFICYGKAKCMHRGCKSIGSYNTQSRYTLKVHYDKMHKSVAHALHAAMAGVSKRGRHKSGELINYFEKPQQISMEEASQKTRHAPKPKPIKEDFWEAWLSQGHQHQQGRLDDSTYMSSRGSMSGMQDNTMAMYFRSSSDCSEIAPKRQRGRPRKLNPDGSYATNHVPLSNSIRIKQYNRRFSTEHARNLIPELCRQMYKMGWMAGTGGSLTIRQEKQIFITPSGISKERVLPQDLFVLDDHGNLLDCPIQDKKLEMSNNAVVFLAIYSMRNAGSIIHSHSPKAVMITLIYKEREFRISHQETIKGMLKGNSGERYSNSETLVIPIIENLPSERDLTERVTIAMQQYPTSNAVLIRRHGIYVWGDTWKTAKGQAECLDYLFELALEMHRHGIDPAATPTDERGIVD